MKMKNVTEAHSPGHSNVQRTSYCLSHSPVLSDWSVVVVVAVNLRKQASKGKVKFKEAAEVKDFQFKERNLVRSQLQLESGLELLQKIRQIISRIKENSIVIQTQSGKSQSSSFADDSAS